MVFLRFSGDKSTDLVNPQISLWLIIDTYKVSTRLDAILYLKTEADPAPETSEFTRNLGDEQSSKNHVI